MRRIILNLLIALSAAITAAGCSNPAFKNLGSSILSSTGMVTHGQSQALFDAGGKIVTAATPLTDEQEYYLGRTVSAVVLSKYHRVSDAALTNYVQSVAAIVAAVSDRPDTFGGYHVGILDTDEVNALSAPGGFIFLSRGFLKIIPNEDALAAVLAHEVGHVVKGHGVSAISQSNLTSAALILGKEAASSYGNSAVKEVSAAFGNSVSEVVDTLLTKGYSRSQEYEADAYAALLLRRARYSPSALTTMLEALAADKKAGGGWFDTHPSPAKRLSEARSTAQDDAGAAKNMAVRTDRFRRATKRAT